MASSKPPSIKFSECVSIESAAIEELAAVLEETLILTKAAILLPRPNDDFDAKLKSQLELTRNWIDHTLCSAGKLDAETDDDRAHSSPAELKGV